MVRYLFYTIWDLTYQSPLVHRGEGAPWRVVIDSNLPASIFLVWLLGCRKSKLSCKNWGFDDLVVAGLLLCRRTRVAWRLEGMPFLQAVSAKLCSHLSSSPCAPHSPPISFSVISSPKYYFFRSSRCESLQCPFFLLLEESIFLIIFINHLLLLLGVELPLVLESFVLLNDIFPFPSILDAGYPVFNHLAPEFYI